MKSLRRVRKRKKRCYELAFKAMLYEPGAEQFTLVHGLIFPGIDHAWIETGDGKIYDPVSDEYTPADQYMRQAVAERRYSKAQAVEKALTEQHSGPWHMSPDEEAFRNSPEYIAWLRKAPGAKVK